MVGVAVIGVGLAMLAGCGDDGAATGSGDDGAATGSGVEPLAKVEGWLSDPGAVDLPYGLMEIADDVDTAERAWQENVPDGLGEGDAGVGEPGGYGSLDDVDFTRQAVVVWHAGESGSCPGWLADIVTEEGAVTIEQGVHAPGDGCTDDYNPYRMVLAVDRDRLPEAGDLPTEDVTIDGIASGRLSAYPDEALSDQGG